MVRFNFSRKEVNSLITFKYLVWRGKDYRKMQSTVSGKIGVRNLKNDISLAVLLYCM